MIVIDNVNTGWGTLIKFIEIRRAREEREAELQGSDTAGRH